MLGLLESLRRLIWLHSEDQYGPDIRRGSKDKTSWQYLAEKYGFSDCGKGQILGQASLLQEYLKKGVQDKCPLERKKQDRQILITNKNSDHENTMNSHKNGLAKEILE